MTETEPGGDLYGRDDPVGYPARWESDVILRDGGTVHVRPIRPSDGPAIRALHARLSAETIYFRFFSPLTTLSPRLLDRFVRVDYVDRLALVALLGDDVIAVGRYERLPSRTGGDDEAEVAFLVDDAHQGRGLGTMLLEHLATIARLAGITRFVADTLPENSRMLRVFHEAGFDDQRTFADGVVRVAFAIAPTEASVLAAHERERTATARSVRRLLAPTSVALVGASRRPDTLGHQLLRTLLESGFNGPVYPVHPDAAHVRSVRAYPTVGAIPDRVDLAVVVVRAEAVPDIVEQCVRKHVGGLVVISSGFADRDDAGQEAERRIVVEARRNGMRLIGPNCMGIVNTDPDIGLNATFSPMPPRGRIGFVAQSGALGAIILDEIARRGLGVSTFVSAGNKADVSGNDLLQYWDEDPATSVVLMYIESFGNPRTFARVAHRVSRHKPIVAVKSGRSSAGAAAAGPARSARQADNAVDALFRRTGVIRTDTLEELFDVCQVLDSQPLPAGRRVAIVGNNGGPGVLAADACAAAGLAVTELTTTTQDRLRSSMRWQGGVANPVDLAPDAPPDAFRLAIDAVLADERIDAVIALYTSPLAAPLPAVTAAMLEARATAPGKPLLACVLGRRGLLADVSREGAGGTIPSFAFPEAAARALGRVADYAEWRRRPEGSELQVDVDAGAVAALVTRALGDLAGGDTGRPDAGGEAGRGDASTDRAGAANTARKPPPATGLWLAAGDAEALTGAYGITVDGGGEGTRPHLTAGVVSDPLFGPLVTFGAGAGDVVCHASRALPLTDLDAAELRSEVLGSLRADGGAWSDAELAGADELLQRVARLAEEVPEVVGMELDRLRLTSSGSVAGSVRLCLAPADSQPERALRRLR